MIVTTCGETYCGPGEHTQGCRVCDACLLAEHVERKLEDMSFRWMVSNGMLHQELTEFLATEEWKTNKKYNNYYK